MKKSNEEEIQTIEKQLEIVQWSHFITTLTEAILLTRLYKLQGESPGEWKIVEGVWIETFGKFIEADSVSKQVQNAHEFYDYLFQKQAISGDTIQTIGSIIQLIGGVEVLKEFNIEGIIP
ncbi:hypothetical protein [Gracilibacillus alcaliphilus]|uniref:hypothetical protein n=1 Tax=Gracilibacillus alcaliphilus TaxID=1401441 RepID=UPI00195735F5|nr:hypothetical protein [Gracilibacillus alcaliphilus]MBM7676651.1 hypothetical protein [Gracilibacillus alcaliphilus]